MTKLVRVKDDNSYLLNYKVINILEVYQSSKFRDHVCSSKPMSLCQVVTVTDETLILELDMDSIVKACERKLFELSL